MVQLTRILALGLLLLGVARGEQPAFASPDGRYVIATESNPGPQSYHVNLIDAKTRKVLDSYNPEMRAIEVYWNPTSKLVAINEDISHAHGNLSLFRIVDGHLESIFLPRKLLWETVRKNDGDYTQDAIYHYIAAEDAKRIKFWWGACQPRAVGWLNATDLGVDVSGTAQLERKFQLDVDYNVMVRVVPPKVSILSETKRQYEISEAKSN